jgi:magnesium transporter
MLTIHDATRSGPVAWKADMPLPAHAAWLDLLDPTDIEVRACEQTAKLKLPTRKDITGVSLPGRNRIEQQVIFLQVPLFEDAGDANAPASPVSVVVTPDLLVTLRYADSATFDIAAKDWHARPPHKDAPACAFAELLETLVERTATSMQKVAGDVADLSGRVFGDKRAETRRLRRWLVHVGGLETRLARNRSSLLGVTRIAEFVCEKDPAWISAEQRSRIETVRKDLVALDHFDEQLTEKLQFLLDAIFGLISVNQNNVMKLFTVASVVAVPPVILAGIWGMNFKAMPELYKPWGYATALGAIMLSILIPLGIFKWRGWLSKD